MANTSIFLKTACLDNGYRHWSVHHSHLCRRRQQPVGEDLSRVSSCRNQRKAWLPARDAAQKMRKSKEMTRKDLYAIKYTDLVKEVWTNGLLYLLRSPCMEDQQVSSPSVVMMLSWRCPSDSGRGVNPKTSWLETWVHFLKQDKYMTGGCQIFGSWANSDMTKLWPRCRRLV